MVGGEEDNREFAFTVNLKNGDGTDLQGEYPCVTYDNQGNILSVGTMNDGGELLLAGGCYAIIRDLPDYVTYNITESEYDCNSYVQEGTLDLSVIPVGSDKREYLGKIVSIQKHPDIVISKEEIFQIAAIVMRDREIDGEMHSEIAVMIQCVIGNRKRFPTT